VADAESPALRVLDLDVNDEASVEAAAERVAAEAGAPDVAVHNAGYMPLGITEAFTADEFTRLLDANVVGVHRVNRAFLPAMRARGSGLIMNVSSTTGRVAVRDRNEAIERFDAGLLDAMGMTAFTSLTVPDGP